MGTVLRESFCDVCKGSFNEIEIAIWNTIETRRDFRVCSAKCGKTAIDILMADMPKGGV